MGACHSHDVVDEHVTDVLAGYPPLAGCVRGAPLAFANRAAGHAAGWELILEGFLTHHGAGRWLDVDDVAVCVLAGDACYAEGLVRVADDLEQVAELAHLIMAASAAVVAGEAGRLGDIWTQAAGEDSPVARAALERIG